MRPAILFLTAALLWAEPAIVTDARKTGLDPTLLAKIPARLKTFVDEGKAVGMVTLVARHGHVAAIDAVGYTDLDTKPAPKARLRA